jgi:hypothetical protein
VRCCVSRTSFTCIQPACCSRAPDWGAGMPRGVAASGTPSFRYAARPLLHCYANRDSLMCVLFAPPLLCILFPPPCAGVPSPRALWQFAAELAATLGVACPPLSPALWLQRYLAELQLPPQLLPVALQLHQLYQPMPLLPAWTRARSTRHPWARLMAALVVAGESAPVGRGPAGHSPRGLAGVEALHAFGVRSTISTLLPALHSGHPSLPVEAGPAPFLSASLLATLALPSETRVPLRFYTLFYTSPRPPRIRSQAVLRAGRRTAGHGRPAAAAVLARLGAGPAGAPRLPLRLPAHAG